jgi:hypothetical protein
MNDRGAVLIHVSVALLVLTAFSAFVIDYGVFWVSRGQAQNAADAGAMAGGVSLAFDNYADRSNTGPAKQAALALATATDVWTQPATVDVGTDISFPADPALCPMAGGGDDPRNYGFQAPCMRVDVYQTLPTFFAQLLGVTSQQVRATAMARFMSGNGTDCLTPLAIPDKWIEVNQPVSWQSPTGLARFNKYTTTGTLLPAAARDSYVAPTPTVPGGFQFTVAASAGGPGFQMTLTEAPLPRAAIGRGQFIPVDIPRVDTSPANAFQASVAGCNGMPIGIDAPLTPLTGSYIASAVVAANQRIGEDPTAFWNPGLNMIQSSCTASTPACAAVSPRLVALPVFNIDRYEDTRWPDMTLDLRIANVIGFFIESTTTTSIVGRITYYPGLRDQNLPGLAFPSTFLRTSMLIR